MSTHEVGSAPVFTGTLEHYARFWTDPFYLETALWTTVRLSVVSTVFALLIGYVLAYYIAELPPHRRGLLTSMVVVSLSVNIVIRIFGLNVLLMSGGLVDSALTFIGMPKVRIMYTELGVLIGLIQIAVPYVVFAPYRRNRRDRPGAQRGGRERRCEQVQDFLGRDISARCREWLRAP